MKDEDRKILKIGDKVLVNGYLVTHYEDDKRVLTTKKFPKPELMYYTGWTMKYKSKLQFDLAGYLYWFERTENLFVAHVKKTVRSKDRCALFTEIEKA